MSRDRDLDVGFDAAPSEGDVGGGGGGSGGVGGNPNCFDLMVEDGNLLDVNDSTIFYSDFPPFPDFPCMSSSSSSSSTPAASRTVIAAANSGSSSAVTSSPAASWAVMKSDNEEDLSLRRMKAATVSLSSTASMELPPPSDTADGVDCIDVMEDFEYMDLIDSNEFWDPSTIFQEEEEGNNNNNHNDGNNNNNNLVAPAHVNQIGMDGQDESNDGLSFLHGNSELAVIFFEWLKQNRDYISAEDMRSIKLKRSTIESASKRLGSSNNGKKQLLKLILEWVEQYQLHKKRSRDNQNPIQIQNQNPNQNPTFTPNLMNYSPIPSYPTPACIPTPPWLLPAPSYPQPATPGYSPGNAYPSPAPISAIHPMNQHHSMTTGVPYPPMMEHAQSWPYSIPAPPPPQFSPFPDSGNAMMGHQYGNQTPNPYQAALGSSVTREARKKRMARQRRHYTHHHRHNSALNSNHSQQSDPNLVGGGDDCDPANWLCCPHGESSPTASPVEASRPSDRRQQQGSKPPEKKLKFLLQKVLKQSDVASLGRIVLPKKEAESHLPELETRDGISIAMEDIGTSCVWNMRYRYWPNNKSRMYLLENTGDFVRVNGLQEGDFIVIYSDTKCGKYMIRGVKVRQPGAKVEGKKPTRKNMRNLSFSESSSSSLLTPITQAV